MYLSSQKNIEIYFMHFSFEFTSIMHTNKNKPFLWKMTSITFLLCILKINRNRFTHIFIRIGV